MLARAPAYSFSRKFLCFRFSRSLKAIKRAIRKVRTIYCCNNIIKMTFVIKLSLLKRKRSAVIIWLCLRLSSICFSEISQNFHNLWNFSCQLFKRRKNRGKIGVQRQFPRYLQFYVFFCCLKFGLLNFFCQQALGRAQICLTVQQIFGNSLEWKAINLARKISIFFVAKRYVKE